VAIELTQEIGRRITIITEETKETTFLFQRLSIALQSGNAVSFHNTMVTECKRRCNHFYLLSLTLIFNYVLGCKLSVNPIQKTAKNIFL